jgi:hypothetical protein
MKRLFTFSVLFAQILFGKPVHAGQDDQMNYSIILIILGEKQGCRGDLVRIVRIVRLVRLVRTFLRKAEQAAGKHEEREGPIGKGLASRHMRRGFSRFSLF